MSRLVLVLRHPDLKSLYDYWLGLCRDETPPMADDVDPADLRPWMGHLVVIKVDPGKGEAGASYTYSFYSQFFAGRFGDDKAGQSVDMLPDGPRDIIRAEYDRVVREHIPVSRVYTADFDGLTQTWERLVLPLFNLEGVVDKLLVAAYELPR
ncbi:PAS domain-containing protein [uncultured Rhodospira sp.]|uniref:PAS domain-containing protein n=1 Tax=uncultured Rhodospira sp. TaxID=1936189 RepID=UPI002610D65D|nr:PAS domain-containing protein [uncultured Rhodospira sp.]